MEKEVKLWTKMKMKAKTQKTASMQRKWSLIILAISIIPLLGSTLFFTAYFGGVTKEDSEANAKTILEMNTSRLNEWLMSKTSAVQELAAQHPEFDTSNPDTIFPAIKVIEDSDRQSEGYSVINKDGLLTNMLGLTAEMGTADYFLKAKETLQPAVADMSYLEPLSKYVISIVVPVTGADKQFAGAIAFSVTPEVMIEMSKDIKVADSGYGYVVSGDGTYYAHYDSQRIGKNIAEYAGGAEMKAALKRILAGQSGSETYKGEDGSQVITYFQNVPGTGWKLMINVPESEIYAKVKSAQMIAVIFLVVVILAVVLLALYLTKRMVKPVTAISQVVKKVAEGHLSERVAVTSNDEIGEMSKGINEMIESLSGIVGMIDAAVAEVAVSSKGLLKYANDSSNTSAEIAEVIREVAHGMEEQFKGSEQSARATEEMAIGLQRIAESSVNVSDQAESVNSEVEQGYLGIQSTLEQMKVISAAAGQTSELIATLTEQSGQIGQIVDVISEISNQTGLLSLNASIEAARAGEHGRGFGVVANEVKKLAERTNTSIVHIVELIRQIQSSTANAAASMDKSITEIGDGMDKMNHVGASFEHIRSSMREVSLQIQDVSAINEEMSAGTEEITASVTDMLTIAKASAENAELVAEASVEQKELMGKVVSEAEALTAMMAELKEEVGRYR
ncbi:methyl-accepting chemotaxis protein [Paenibacillus sp. FSL R7-0331]|uniref:methyl-accepting chemotaxis protein n=1 Tax=Paenibacillus sp. FSL R7-0331 TaxID=1536773 RepID=UPI000A8C3887|nr:methyl-accepting chemotaxis protein [Paenibacillus sp. FSL R7-0331]